MTAAERQQKAMDAAPLFMFLTGGVGRISIVAACYTPPARVLDDQLDLFGGAA